MLINLKEILESKGRGALKSIIQGEKRGAGVARYERLVKKYWVIKSLIPLYTDEQIELLYNYVRRKL